MIVDAAAENFPFLIITACTGMRKGELRALRWEDVDFERGVIMVRHNASRWNTMGPTKSISGERTIQMWPIVEYTLREWKEICPRGRTPGFYTPEHTVLKIGKFLAENPGISDKKASKHFGVCHLTVRHVRKVMPFPEKGPPEFVFPNRSGGIQDGSNVWRQFRRLQRKLGMTDDATAHGRPKYSSHHLRHFFASWEMNQGRPILDLARELGHKDASMILKVYGHAFDDPDAARVRAHASQAALLGSPRPQQN
jgi:integrase